MTRLPECINPLRAVLREHAALPDFAEQMSDALKLRRISMTLHAWFELECGSDRGAIERDEVTDIPYWYNANASHLLGLNKGRYRVPDREKGARKRLDAIMAKYPGLRAYVQGDPRGCALYILRPGDVPPGGEVDAYYSRGIGVYK